MFNYEQGGDDYLGHPRIELGSKLAQRVSPESEFLAGGKQKIAKNW